MEEITRIIGVHQLYVTLYNNKFELFVRDDDKVYEYTFNKSDVKELVSWAAESILGLFLSHFIQIKDKDENKIVILWHTSYSLVFCCKRV